MDSDARIPRSRRLIAEEDDQTCDASPYPISPINTGGIALSYSEKAEAIANSLETQFQPLTDPEVLLPDPLPATSS